MTAKGGPRPLPWALAAALALALVGPGLATAVIDPSLVAATLAGSLTGVFGAIFGARRQAIGAALAALICGLLFAAAQTGLDARLPLLLLAGLASLETRSGGRSMTIAIIGALTLGAALDAGAPPPTSILLFGAAAALGIVSTQLLSMAGRVILPAYSKRGALGFLLFMAVGLILSLILAEASETPQALWVVKMFAVRGLAGATLSHRQAGLYVLGICAGAAAAVAVELALPHPPLVRLGLASVALVAGLRWMPQGPPWSTALFTVALLLVLAPTPEAALFRVEAGFAVAILALVLAEAIGWLLGRSRAVAPPPQREGPGRAQG